MKRVVYINYFQGTRVLTELLLIRVVKVLELELVGRTLRRDVGGRLVGGLALAVDR